MKKKGLVFVFLLLHLTGWGQHLIKQEFDTLIHLKEVSITSGRINYYSAGTVVEGVDKNLLALNQSGSLSDLFVNHSNLQVNTYGPGGVSNISIRGGKTRNTAVLWNGLNLQSPMHGGTNISNIPAGFFDAIKIQKGHTVSLFGSGATSGIVHLMNVIPETEGTRVKIFGHSGSFSTLALGTAIALRKENYSSQLKIFRHQSANNFRYKNPYPFGEIIKRQSHAGYMQQAMLWDHSLQMKNNQLISAGIWYQQSDKDIQGLMTLSRPEQAHQKDKTLRGYAKYSLNKNNHSFRIRQGIIHDDFLYSDPEGPEYKSHGRSFNAMTEAEANINLSTAYQINTGISNTLEQCASDGYTTQVFRHRQAVFGSFSARSQKHRIRLSLNARQELVDGKFVPFVFSLGSNLKTPLEGMELNASLSKNNLIPTFNDLYWKETSFASGNPELKNELSWNTEAGITWKKTTTNLQIELSNQFFRNQYKNLIIWLPDQNGKWSPENKEQVLSHGIEVNTRLEQTNNNWKHTLHSIYTYTFAYEVTSGEESPPPPMIYTPKHKLGVTFSTEHTSGLHASVHYKFTDKRFYDYTNTVDAYHLVDIVTGYAFMLWNTKIESNLKIYNLFNTDYQVMAWYAMPLRHFQVQLIINI